MLCGDLDLESGLNGMQVSANHVLNTLHCSFRSAIAGTLAHGAELRYELKDFLVNSRIDSATDLHKCCLNDRLDSGLLIRLVHKLCDS